MTTAMPTDDAATSLGTLNQRADEPVPTQREADAPTPEPSQRTGGYAAVPAQLDLPRLDHEILELWAARGTFEKSLAATSNGPRWTFYEGPPTANGTPGTHHIEARVFKDVFPRFKTMQGYRCDRKAGWDCHGLPVEIAVEQELGLGGKPDIETYGIAAFNARCRESVGRYVGMFQELTTRMGYWVNLDEAYWTMATPYVQSVWWALQQIHGKGLLVEDYRVTPYCPRCGTTLSDHELAQGYEEDRVTTAYVRLPLISGPWAHRASLLVWTTTPWTLISNTAAAVNPEVTYAVATKGNDTVVFAADLEPAMQATLGGGYEVVATVVGAEMERWAYERPFDVVEMPGEANYVILGDFVTTQDGTGIVHEAPAFGEIDMVACRAYGLPFVNPIRPDGTFEAGLELVGGVFFSDADALVLDSLRARGRLAATTDITHQYPHCWRCDTALIYYAQPSWYIRTTAIKDALLRENEATTWYPETIKHGRYGDWLNNNIDWALSRTRYWGTPLPIWRCPDGHQTCVGSLAELSELTGTDQSALDPHRPYVDEIAFPCPCARMEPGDLERGDGSGVPGRPALERGDGTGVPRCGKEARRVPEVIDAWFDSGSMPFAQRGYPWQPGSTEALDEAFPADFICEAIDQTRGWFYSLMAVSTLVFDRSSYKNVLCLGHILDEEGRKMSKHLGNVLEPIPLLESNGADAVRWFMACSGSPWASRRVGHATMQEVVRKVLLTYWNTVSFQALYARANAWTPADGPSAPPVAGRHVLDRWLVSTTQRLVNEVTARLEDFDTQRAGTLLSTFIDDLSNWYVRRSRRRFWDGDPGALWTLHETLGTLTRLLAPLVPFITERVWQDLFVASGTDGGAESVHLASWPAADASLLDEGLESAMALTRALVELGRSARADAKVRTRQPLARVLIGQADHDRLTDELRDEIRAELNVGEVGTFTQAGDLIDYTAKANFRSLGRRYGQQTPLVAQAVAAADAAWLARSLAAVSGTDGATVPLDVPGVGTVELGTDDVFLSEHPRAGWSVLQDAGHTIALDLELTPALVSAGLAREVIRAVQEARKASGFDVSDRIALTWQASDPATAAAIREHASLIADEVLAVRLAEAPSPTGPHGVFAETDLGLRFTVSRS